MEALLNGMARLAGTQLTKARWALGLNGLLSTALGIVILAWPGITLEALTILIGAYALVTGVMGLLFAFTAEETGERGWLVFSSLLGIAVGLVVLIWPDISALALLYVIGAYAIALGIIAIGGAFWLSLDGGEAALLVLSGLVSILFGIVMLARPGDGALVALVVIAAFLLVAGVTQLIVAIGGKRMVDNGFRRAFAP